MVFDEPTCRKEWKHRRREQTLDIVREGESGMNGESKHQHICTTIGMLNRLPGTV